MAKHLRITGIVQGVGYRAAFEREAHAVKLAGWVRNRHDGSVEALVRGDEDAIKHIIEWAHQGPRMARVIGVTVTETPDADVPQHVFSVLPNA